MLFLTEDNDFAGRDQTITIDEINNGIVGMH
jgi:ferredoxin-thioredoxin reductase catalytic chain